MMTMMIKVIIIFYNNGTVILFSTVSSEKLFSHPVTAQQTILVLHLIATLTAVWKQVLQQI
jgi:hypothetical protein